jgi:hypothetical protein
LRKIELYRGSECLGEKFDDISNGGTFTFNFSIKETGSEDTVNYEVKVYDADSDSAAANSKLSYSFVYPYFYGVFNGNLDDIDSDTIVNFEEKGIRAKGDHSHSYTTKSSEERPVIAYPKAYGPLRSIIDPNGFT